MPLDPVAWLVMYGEHQAALGDLIAANMRHRLPLEAVRDALPPAQQQVCVRSCCVLHEKGIYILHVQLPQQVVCGGMCTGLHPARTRPLPSTGCCPDRVTAH